MKDEMNLRDEMNRKDEKKMNLQKEDGARRRGGGGKKRIWSFTGMRSRAHGGGPLMDAFNANVSFVLTLSLLQNQKVHPCLASSLLCTTSLLTDDGKLLLRNWEGFLQGWNK